VEPFEGTVLRDGAVVLAKVFGTLYRCPDLGDDWFGHFPLPEQAQGMFLASGEYRLRLADGRCGFITVARKPRWPRPGDLVHFEGCGALRAAGGEG
jgi:hypothetical protein